MNAMKNLRFAVCAAVVASASVVGATVRYVDNATGDDSSDGTATPCKTLKGAVDKAAAGDEIVLLRGTQKLGGTVTVDKAVSIRGEGKTGETLIDEANSANQLLLTASGTCVSDLTFYRLGAIQAVQLLSDSEITRVDFTGYYPANVFSDNACPLYVTNGLVTCCAITNNTSIRNASGTAGIWVKGMATIENCLIANNRNAGTSEATGVLNIVVPKTLAESPVVRNCTIVNNSVGCRAAIYVREDYDTLCYAKFYNNIVFGNENSSSGAAANYALYWNRPQPNWIGNCVTPLTNLPANGGNFTDDPLLMSDGIHLSSESPCRGAARTGQDADGVDYAAATDFDGKDRGQSPSLGAFEYAEIVLPIILNLSASAETAYCPETIVVTCAVSGDYVAPLSYAWDFDNDGTVDATTAVAEISAAGTYVGPSVTVTDANGKTQTGSLPGTYTVIQLASDTIYVDTTGDDGNSGDADHPVKTLAKAVELAPEGSDVIVRRGTHSLASSVTVDKILTIRGEGKASETVIEDGHSSRTILISSDRVKLCNLTFAQLGGVPAVLQTGAATISNVVFTGYYPYNAAADNACVVKITKGRMTGCVFTANKSVRNHSGTAGAWVQGDSVVENCLFACNTNTANSAGTGVLYVNSETSVIRNCTVVDNVVEVRGAVYSHETDYYNQVRPAFHNNIFYNNANAAGETKNFALYAEVGNTTADWKGNCTSPIAKLPANVGNIDADPLFKDGDPLRLSDLSPCRDTGLTALGPVASADILGNPRVVGAAIDIGCVEWQPPNGLILIFK